MKPPTCWPCLVGRGPETLSLSPGEQSPEAEVRHRALSEQATPQSQEERVLRLSTRGDEQGSDRKKKDI